MIKRKVCLTHFMFFLIFISGFRVFAQEKIAVGISAQMLNTRFLTNVMNPQTKGAYRPTSTLFAEYSIGKNYGIHAGLGYSMMTQNSDAFKNNFHYLTVPVYFKIGRLKKDQRVVFTSFYGANLHYLMRAQHVSLEDKQTDIIDLCRKYHFDFTAGGGLKIKLSDKMAIEALSSLSLGYFINKRNAVDLDINNLNTGFMLNFSYKLK